MLLLTCLLFSLSSLACEGLNKAQPITADEASWSPYLRQGMKHFSSKQYKHAVACFKKVVPFAPGIAYIRIATTYDLRFKTNSNDTQLREQAIAYYNRSLEFPDNIAVNYARTQLKKLLMSYTPSEFTQSVLNHPNRSHYHNFNAGLYYMHQGMPEKSLHYLTLAAEKKYWHAKLLLGLAHNPASKFQSEFSYFEKDIEKALYWLNKAHNQMPTTMLERQILHLEEYKKSRMPTEA